MMFPSYPENEEAAQVAILITFFLHRREMFTSHFRTVRFEKKIHEKCAAKNGRKMIFRKNNVGQGLHSAISPY